MNWERLSLLCLSIGDYRVAKVCVQGEWLYEAWRTDGRSSEMLGSRLRTAQEAKQLCEEDARESENYEA